MFKLIILSSMSLLILATKAHDSTKTNPSTFSGYAEVYANYDIAIHANHERPSFLLKFNKDNEMSLNPGFIHASYTSQNVCGNFVLLAGTCALFRFLNTSSLIHL